MCRCRLQCPKTRCPREIDHPDGVAPTCRANCSARGMSNCGASLSEIPHISRLIACVVSSLSKSQSEPTSIEETGNRACDSIFVGAIVCRLIIIAKSAREISCPSKNESRGFLRSKLGVNCSKARIISSYLTPRGTLRNTLPFFHRAVMLRELVRMVRCTTPSGS